MKIIAIDEKEFVKKFRKENHEGFQAWIDEYDRAIAPALVAAGWKYETKAKRRVLFIHGDEEFKRRAYRRNGEWRYPVDERLGLEKNERYSREMLLQIARLSTMMVYRRVPEVVEMMYGVYITKDTVSKAVKLATQLFIERDEYHFYEEHQGKKVETPVIYIEGDGVMIRTKIGLKNWTDMAHFVVHTGSEKVGKRRYKLQNKREIISISHADAKQKLEQCLSDYYHITDDTIFITNSDMGTGYGAKVFKELVALFNVKRHEHFWDLYHLNKMIKNYFKKKSTELMNLCFESITTHDKGKMKLVLDEVESDYVDTDDEYEEFNYFKNRLLNNFQYTTPAELRGLSNRGIGIMESQHRKITYRMKGRGMYWSLNGAQSMGRMIILEREDGLRELFFGRWREEWEKLKNLPATAGEYLKQIKSDGEGEYGGPRGTVHLVIGKPFR